MVQDKYYFKNPDSPLRRLEGISLENILSEYAAGNSVAGISVKYNLPNLVSLHKNLPAKLSDKECEFCGTLIYEKIKRTGISTDISTECHFCKHNSSQNCQCENCVKELEKRENLKNAQIILVRDHYYSKFYNLKYTVENLSIYDEINLIIIFDKSFNLINFIKEYAFGSWNQLLPNLIDEILAESINQLIIRKILIPDLSFYSTDPFYYSKNDLLPNFSTPDVLWISNILDENGLLIKSFELSEKLQKRIYSYDEKEALWREIYATHIKKYILFQLDINNFIFISDQSMEIITDDLIAKFSLSKAYAILWMAIKSTAKYKEEYKANKSRTESHFLSRVKYLILKHNDLKRLKDFNLPSSIKLCHFDSYVLKNILHHENTYFYLSSDKLLEMNQI